MKNIISIIVLLGILAVSGCQIDGSQDMEDVKIGGKFAYDVILPQGLIKAELILKSVTQSAYTGKADLLGYGKNKGELITIPEGYYKLSFNLFQKDFTTAGISETINIKKNQTTSITIDFTNVVFAPAPDPSQIFTIKDSGGIKLENLTNNQIYAIAVNPNQKTVRYTDAGAVVSYMLNGTKYQVAYSGRSINPETKSEVDLGDSYLEKGDKIPLQFDKAETFSFNANPLPIPVETQGARSARFVSFTQPVVGDKRMFWLDDAEKIYKWQEIEATLAAVSNHANIWIVNNNFDNSSSSLTDNKLTFSQAQAMAVKFDAIYQYTTPIFGNEYGGSSDSPQPGGMDGDKKVQILFYDIGASGAAGGTVGYFWSKDHYTNEYLQSNNYSYKSNLAEMFYINSYWADSQPDVVYSALIHEFVHMINFNEKTIKQKLNFATWYTEMLAMLGEDIVGPMIGINPYSSSHPISTRIPYTLGFYSCDPFFWSGFKSYGVTFGYGAYLARNYGGPALVKEIALNDKTNYDSINAAVSKFDSSVDFKNTVERYYEAFINNDTLDRGIASFNRTVSSIIEGYQYTQFGFDIFEMNRVNVALSPGFISYWSTTEKGPFLYSLTQNFYLDYYTFILMSCANWQDVSGSLIIDLKKPNLDIVNMHLAVR